MPLAQLFPHFRDAWVLHHDADLVVVDKPPFMSTHAPDPERHDDAHARLSAWLRERGEKDPYLGIHQRLDRDTSGVLLFTRRKEANRSIAAQFEQRRVEKTYVAVVALGAPPEPPGPARHAPRVDPRRPAPTRARGRGAPYAPSPPPPRTRAPSPAGLSDQGVLRHRIAPGKDGVVRVLGANAKEGQEAVTRYRVLARHGGRAVVELTPETGRTHQIRAQLAAIGAPIVGDTMYGGAPAPRLLLHASVLAIRHPATDARISFRAPAPASFEAFARTGALDGAVSLPRDATELEARLRAAADRRYGVAHLEGTTAFRIANGAGDALPGVDVDVYGDHLVVALSGDDADAAREAVLDAAASLGVAGVYLKVRPRHASVLVDTRREAVAPRDPVRGAPAPADLRVSELGLPFRVALGDGLSTGIFLDQRENRRRVREMSGASSGAVEGARVANLFAYTGAFTVAAVAGGARSSVTVDVSPTVAAWARENLARVGADPRRHTVVEADARAWLEKVAPRGELFDLIILDPPSFSTTKQSRFSADGDYRAIAALAYRALAPGGRLLACTNHRGILRVKLRRFLHEAARDSGRDVVQMKDLPDPEDFPPEPGHEPHLKSVLVTTR